MYKCRISTYALLSSGQEAIRRCRRSRRSTARICTGKIARKEKIQNYNLYLAVETQSLTVLKKLSLKLLAEALSSRPKVTALCLIIPSRDLHFCPISARDLAWPPSPQARRPPMATRPTAASEPVSVSQQKSRLDVSEFQNRPKKRHPPKN